MPRKLQGLCTCGLEGCSSGLLTAAGLRLSAWAPGRGSAAKPCSFPCTSLPGSESWFPHTGVLVSWSCCNKVPHLGSLYAYLLSLPVLGLGVRGLGVAEKVLLRPLLGV